MLLLQHKRALILGVANERSIAWGIARNFAAHGARIGITYQSAPLKKRIEGLLASEDSVGSACDFLLPFDAAIDDDYPRLACDVASYWPSVEVLVHSLAYARKEDLSCPFHQTSREGFNLALDISAFSLIGLANAFRPQLSHGASIISMTYHGSQQVLPSYKVMGVAKAALEASSRYLASDLGPKYGIRVNCISSGPIRTLAASAVGPINKITKVIEERAPLRRTVTTEDVGKSALYLASDLSSGMTGQIIYVDAGVSIQAMDEFSTSTKDD
ncbi:MAG: enoyl-ACP reductase [Oligoflexia bacterium]|nr:enoyl-ACP reductase [Oligoflexia bacterium]MBF0364837.1 enoyl-ACP reductase [Oligoflexia bacterium]